MARDQEFHRSNLDNTTMISDWPTLGRSGILLEKPIHKNQNETRYSPSTLVLRASVHQQHSLALAEKSIGFPLAENTSLAVSQAVCEMSEQPKGGPRCQTQQKSSSVIKK